MEPKDFNEWRVRLGLSLRQVASELKVSLPTAHAYDRGFRPDNRRPVVIPKKIALACEALSARAYFSGDSTERIRPSTAVTAMLSPPLWGDLSPVVKEQITAELRRWPRPYEVPTEQIFLTKLDRFLPLAAEIVDWLSEHVGKGIYPQIVPHPDPAEGLVVVIEIADPNQAFEFKVRWRGFASDDGDEA